MRISKITVESIVFHRNDFMSVTLSDERTITVPLAWYPRLLNAPRSARRRWELSAAGQGIHWPEIDEDLSVAGLLNGQPSPEYRGPRAKKSSTQPECRA